MDGGDEGGSGEGGDGEGGGEDDDGEGGGRVRAAVHGEKGSKEQSVFLRTQ